MSATSGRPSASKSAVARLGISPGYTTTDDVEEGTVLEKAGLSTAGAELDEWPPARSTSGTKSRYAKGRSILFEIETIRLGERAVEYDIIPRALTSIFR
jgi:hypothetical protein